ncbi:hypothetical protein ACFFQW_01765 [Umezawaea endophytica]|uniref:Uncharacterized protein n=1 Tax=Umezawaea endophytica TaxID=1654476 RepID=A0A9X2VHY3_9PSEU|nr:hypothetical protein [Umezawaea endophytica]MCS7476976.1 hypothetical protein [Umezawaea endophytica]
MRTNLIDHDFDGRLAQLQELVEGARSLSEALAWWTGGGALTIHVLGSRKHVLSAREYVDLRGHRHTTGHERTGMLSSARGGRTLALTRALIIPDRIPRSVRLECGIPHPDNPEVAYATRVPLGVALATTCGPRFRRAEQTVRSIVFHEDETGEPMSLQCTATLLLDDEPIGLVTERLTRLVVEEFAPPGSVADYLRDQDGASDVRPHWWSVESLARRWNTATRGRKAG